MGVKKGICIFATVTLNKYIMAITITKENATNAVKKALEHKKEAKRWFELWLQEKGVKGKVISL